VARVEVAANLALLANLAIVVFLGTLLLPSSALAQYPDAYIVPRGVLRVSFEPSYTSWRERYDSTGNIEALGADFTDSTAGVRLFPTLSPAEYAIRSLIGDSAYAMNVGNFKLLRDADVRRTPFNFQFGLTNWLTITASIPFVSTRSQVTFTADSTNANVGWNQIAPEANASTAAASLQSLLVQLEAGASYVESQMAAGAYGCPSDPACDDAAAMVARARAFASGIGAMSGINASGTVVSELPPFAPLANSAAGTALRSELTFISDSLVSLGASGITAAIPLPSIGIGPDGVNAVLGDSAFGYLLQPLEFSKYRNALGDIEVGFRTGLLQEGALRAVLVTTVRLPTGKRDLPDHLLDIGSGDKQTDLIFGLETAWQPTRFLALAASGSYTLQLPDRLERRATLHTVPIVPASAQSLVNRNLGDELRLAVYPSLRLSDAFTAYFSASYWKKGADTYSSCTPYVLPQVPLPSNTTCGLDFETSMRALYLGGGVHYRAVRGRRGVSLPVEAGIDYHAAFRGAGGQTPKDAGVYFYLRLYYRLFGGAPSAGSDNPLVPNP